MNPPRLRKGLLQLHRAHSFFDARKSAPGAHFYEEDWFGQFLGEFSDTAPE
jgi:hypothetical protein